MYIFYLIFRIFLYPFIRYLLPLYSKKVAARVEFELQNLQEKKPFQKADYGFEISSQGELEQVKFLLLYLLERKKTVELIFCSESVEKECSQLKREFPNNLALMRMPLITFHPGIRAFNPKKWLSCETFFLCRYDFFPSLISFGRKCESFYLLSGTLKNFEKKNFLARKYLRFCYSSFQKIIVSHKGDISTIVSECNYSRVKIMPYDFRINQILARQAIAERSIVQVMGESYKLISASQEKYLFGSFWDSECSLFSSVNLEQENVDFFLTPHKLDPGQLSSIKSQIEGMGGECFHISSQLTEKDIEDILKRKRNGARFYILDFRGILCELYNSFTHVYVGGGFGDSVHSLMEPFLGNCHVYCGPKVERSTEYSFIKENYPTKINALKNRDEVVGLMIKDKRKTIDKGVLEMSDVQDSFDSVLEWLEIAR